MLAFTLRRAIQAIGVMIAVGAMSPLEGFMGSEDWKGVVARPLIP